MAAQAGSSFSEGQSTNRPPLFNGSNYSYWKARMRIFIQALDYDLWSVIINGPSTPTHLVDGSIVPKPERDWNENDRKMAQLNAKAMNVLYCSLDANEFNRISTCISAKEIWDRLEVTHEGTNQVKESKINILVHKYELFNMDQNESITCMYTRFTDIVNGLKSLGKTYTNSEMVQKILRSLPRSWEAKVTAIQEAKDLNTLPLEELLGSLMTHELTMKQHQEDDVKKKRTIALKAAENEKSSSEEDEDDDETALLARKFKKFMQRRRPFHKRKIGIKMEGDKEKDKDKEKDPLICYECKKPGHFRSECPQLKKGYKKKKKAYVATWSDSEESSSEDDQQEVANICLMANNEDEVNSETPNYDFTFDELYDAFNELLSDFKVLRTKNKVLKTENLNLLKKKNDSAIEIEKLNSEKQDLEKEKHMISAEYFKMKDEFVLEIEKIKSEKQDMLKEKELISAENLNLKKEVEKYKSIVDKFTYSSERLNLLLNNQRAIFDKAGLGYKPHKK